MLVDPLLPLCNLYFSVFYDEITPTTLNHMAIPIQEEEVYLLKIFVEELEML